MNLLFFSNILPGTLLFGRFEAIRCLSASDIGAVYLCRDVACSGSEVALKVLSADAVADHAKLEELRREMLIASAIDHPNVVRSHSFFQDEHYSAFTMEYFAGGTLADQIDRHNTFSIEFIERTLRQLCAGLRAIHRAGIIHRDLKPENILIDSSFTMKISDFGIAVPAAGHASSSNDSLVGTMNYLSPEYIERGVVDERSDIYAVGVIAYEMVTGRLPFQKGSLLESLTSRVKFDPEAPCSLRKDCPVYLSTIIMKALERNPLKRYRSASEMLHALDQRYLDEALAGMPLRDSQIRPAAGI